MIAFCFLILCGHAQDNVQLPNARQAAVAKVLKKYTALGIPGLAISVSSPEGTWSRAEGFANVEKGTPLTTGHVHYLQSVSKTYMAVAILQLIEAGRLDPDSPFTTYLKDPVLQSIQGSDRITVRMLLNNTSGLPEYNTHPE